MTSTLTQCSLCADTPPQGIDPYGDGESRKLSIILDKQRCWQLWVGASSSYIAVDFWQCVGVMNVVIQPQRHCTTRTGMLVGLLASPSLQCAKACCCLSLPDGPAMAAMAAVAVHTSQEQLALPGSLGLAHCLASPGCAGFAAGPVRYGTCPLAISASLMCNTVKGTWTATALT